MTDFENLGELSALSTDLSLLLQRRFDQAEPIKLLSSRNDKVVEVVQESDGRKLVTRKFRDDAVEDIESRADTSFTKAWDIMQQLFTAKNMRTVPSSLMSKMELYSQVVISEYIENGSSLFSAPTELKKDLAHNLGQMLDASVKYLPSSEMLMSDMFQVVQKDDGTAEVLLIDVDPRVIPRASYEDDMLNALFIDKVASLIWNDWCDETERAEVMRLFVASVADSLGRDMGMSTLASFSNAHLRSQGIDPRAFGL